MTRPPSDKQNVSIRIDAPTVARLEALVSRMSEATGVDIDGAQVHRAALAAGLTALEARYPATCEPTAPAPAPKPRKRA